MIVFNFSGAGNREENLDILSKINCHGDIFGAVIMDGDSCAEYSMELLS